MASSSGGVSQIGSGAKIWHGKHRYGPRKNQFGIGHYGLHCMVPNSYRTIPASDFDGAIIAYGNATVGAQDKGGGKKHGRMFKLKGPEYHRRWRSETVEAFFRNLANNTQLQYNAANPGRPIGVYNPLKFWSPGAGALWARLAWSSRTASVRAGRPGVVRGRGSVLSGASTPAPR